jgi:hypothetical protein
VIYELLYPLRHDAAWLGWLNVLRYVPFRTIAATVSAMLLAFVLAPWFIRELQRKQIGQVVRTDGPESHMIKSGTPTMGGAPLRPASDDPLVRPPQRLRLGDDGRDRGVRRHRVPR